MTVCTSDAKSQMIHQQDFCACLSAYQHHPEHLKISHHIQAPQQHSVHHLLELQLLALQGCFKQGLDEPSFSVPRHKKQQRWKSEVIT